MGTKATQMTQVVYMAKPMNLASLKFSGKLRVFTAYTVHMPIRKKSNPNGAIRPLVVVSQMINTLDLDGKNLTASAGSRINMETINMTSTAIIAMVIKICAVSESQRDFLVQILFLLPASIRAIRFVFVKRAAKMSEKLNPGRILDNVQLRRDGTASNGNVVK